MSIPSDMSPTAPATKATNKANTFDLVESMLTFSKDPIASPLLKLPAEMNSVAVMVFKAILRYTGDAPGDYALTEAERDQLAHQIVMQAMQGQQLADELYMQLIKQSRKNPRVDSLLR